MTRKALEKIEGTPFKAALEYKMSQRVQLAKAGYADAADAATGSIAGYVQALRDAGIITESERKCLFIYYGTIAGTAKEA